jgi:hypothetical protein
MKHAKLCRCFAMYIKLRSSVSSADNDMLFAGAYRKWPRAVLCACAAVCRRPVGTLQLSLSIDYTEEANIMGKKMAVFWVVAPCRLVWVYRRFGGLYCLHHQGDESTQRYNPQDSHVHTHRRENFKPYTLWVNFFITVLFLSAFLNSWTQISVS